MAKPDILIVDDEEDILELVEYKLAKDGYRPECVATGEDALRVARAKVPDLVILDLMLPGVDGLAVCKILKNDPKTSHVPVIMLTAKGEEADVVAGLELGADDCVWRAAAGTATATASIGKAIPYRATRRSATSRPASTCGWTWPTSTGTRSRCPGSTSWAAR